MDFDRYELDASIYDEMFLPDGTPRQHCGRLHEELRGLSPDEIANIQERVMRSFSNEGITFTVYGDEEAEERIIPVDCLPASAVGGGMAPTRGRLGAAHAGAEPVPRGRLRRGPHRGGRRDTGRRGAGLPSVPRADARLLGTSRCVGGRLRHRRGAHRRRVSRAGRQPESPLRGLLHDRQPQGHEGQSAPTVSELPGAGGGALRQRSADNPAGTRATGPERPRPSCC